MIGFGKITHPSHFPKTKSQYNTMSDLGNKMPIQSYYQAHKKKTLLKLLHETPLRGIPQGSYVGHLLFNINAPFSKKYKLSSYMNSLPYMAAEEKINTTG